MTEYLLMIAKISVALIAFKALIGYRWPWEICDCCGDKIIDHDASYAKIESRTMGDNNNIT